MSDEPISDPEPTPEGAAVNSLLVALKYVGAFFLFYAGLATLQVLVHPFNFSSHALSVVGQSMRDGSRLAGVLAAAIVSFFALDAWLGRKSRRASARKERVGASRLFLFGSMVVLVAMALFWLTDGRHIPLRWVLPGLYVVTWAMLPGALLLGILLGLAARYGPKWLWWLTFVPPIGLMVAALVVAQILCMLLGGATCFPVAWPTMQNVQIALSVLLGGALFVGYLEMRTLEEWRRTADCLLVGLWLIAVAAQYTLVMFFHGSLCTMIGEGALAEFLAVRGVGCVWVLAVGGKLLIHRKQSRAAALRAATESMGGQTASGKLVGEVALVGKPFDRLTALSEVEGPPVAQ